MMSDLNPLSHAFTNQHVGGGGGQPHLHGDPFGSWCLYSAANYTSSTVHPPQIGWAFDGPSIYGRHLSTSNLGYSTPLDSCGGHVHDGLAYHYHAQVFTALTDTGAIRGQAAGQPYYASTTGPYKCFKGDISLITNYWGMQATSFTSVLPDTTTQMCYGTTNYYTASGMVLTIVSSKPTRTPTSAPTKIPTASPTAIPTTAPSPWPTAVPTDTPTAIPTDIPTAAPTDMPTAAPTEMPSL